MNNCIDVASVVRYTCSARVLPHIEAELTANGYAPVMPQQHCQLDTEITMMFGDGRLVLLVNNPATADADIEVWGDDHGILARWLESLQQPVFRQQEHSNGHDHAAHPRTAASSLPPEINLSVIAHELKTPLTVMLGSIQLLQQRLACGELVNERDQQLLNRLVAQARHLDALLTDLFNVSRLAYGQIQAKCEPIDVRETIQRSVKAVQPTAQQHILRCILPETPTTVLGDRVLLDHALQNLVSNAIKYSPPGSIVEIRAEQREQWLCIAITDQGIGIPAAARDHLFEPFYRASNAQRQHIPGTGIGLYVVKEFIALLGGTIKVDSFEGDGSTITMWLPATDV